VAAWLVAGETVLVGNLGDAKAVLARESLPTVKNKGISQCTASTGVPSPPRALVLTKDHLCLVPTERARIQRAGGSISADGRLNGRLQVRFWCGPMAPTLPKKPPSIASAEHCFACDLLVCRAGVPRLWGCGIQGLWRLRSA
jgi:Protein phosphatase 2C